MAPPPDKFAVGELWYKTILQNVVCPVAHDPDILQYNSKPVGFEIGSDQLNWAIVLPSNVDGMQIRLWSNGKVIQSIQGKPGLNYGAASGVEAGQQRMELLDMSGNVRLAASGGRCISAECPDCIYNMNPQVLPLIINTGAIGECPVPACKTFASPVFGAVDDSWDSEKLNTVSWISERGKCKVTDDHENCELGTI